MTIKKLSSGKALLLRRSCPLLFFFGGRERVGVYVFGMATFLFFTSGITFPHLQVINRSLNLHRDTCTSFLPYASCHCHSRRRFEPSSATIFESMTSLFSFSSTSNADSPASSEAVTEASMDAGWI